MWDGFAVHFYFLYRIWMQKNMKLLADCFAENQDPGYFNAAACTSGTCTDKHQQHQDCPRNFRPGIKICCCISGCCDNGTNLESCLLKSFGCTSENMVNIAGDDKNCNTDDSEIIPHFFHFKSLSKFFCDNEKVSIKVNAK